MFFLRYMDVSKNRDTPKWMVYNGKPYENGWFGGTTIFGNTHIFMELLHFRIPEIPQPFWPVPWGWRMKTHPSDRKFSGATCAYIKRPCMVFVVLSVLTELCSRFLLPHKGWDTVFIGKAKGVYKLQPAAPNPHLVQRLLAWNIIFPKMRVKKKTEKKRKQKLALHCNLWRKFCSGFQ